MGIIISGIPIDADGTQRTGLREQAEEQRRRKQYYRNKLEFQEEHHKKQMELMESKIQRDKLSLMKDYIRMNMSNKEIANLTGFTEEQIYNYRISFRK